MQVSKQLAFNVSCTACRGRAAGHPAMREFAALQEVEKQVVPHEACRGVANTMEAPCHVWMRWRAAYTSHTSLEGKVNLSLTHVE